MRYQVHSRGKKKVIIISCLPTGSKLSEREEEEKKIRYFFFLSLSRSRFSSRLCIIGGDIISSSLAQLD